MNFPTLQHQAGRLSSWLLPLLAFALPLSTSALSILAILIFLLWLIEGRFKEKMVAIAANPVVMAVLLYLSLLVVGLLWTSDLSNGWSVLQKNWKLMLLPVFITAMRPSLRRITLGSFVAGMTVAMIITYLAWFGLIQSAEINPARLTRGTFHVVYNPMLAFAIYLLAHEVLWGKVKGIGRWTLLGLVAVMTVNMFITEGRCGQLVFFVLLALLCLQIFRKHIFRALLIVALSLPLLFMIAYQASPVFHGRVDRGVSKVRQFQNNPNTSVGLRLLFWQNSWEIITHNLWIGVGTGDFPTAYATINRKNSPRFVATDNPHNQFVLAGCQLGLLGITSLMAIFIIQMIQGKLRTLSPYGDGWQRVRLAFPVFFLTIMLTESYLIIASTGFLFSLFSAVFYISVSPEPDCHH